MCFEAQRLETGNDELHGGKSHLMCTKLSREGLLLKDRQRCAGRGWSEGRAGNGDGNGRVWVCDDVVSGVWLVGSGFTVGECSV